MTAIIYYLQLLFQKLKKNSPPLKFDLKNTFILKNGHSWRFPDKLTLIETSEWLLISYSYASILAVPLAEISRITNQESIYLDIFLFPIELDRSILFLLIFFLFFAFYYRDIFWKKTIPLFSRDSFEKEYKGFNISKLALIAGTINLYIILYKLTQIELLELFFNIFLFSMFLSITLIVFIANFAVKDSYNKKKIEKFIRTVEVPHLEKSIFENSSITKKKDQTLSSKN